MCTMPITVFIYVILRDSLSPVSTFLKLYVVNVDTGVDNIDINTLATIGVILVLGKGAETELRSVTDTR